MNVITRGVRSTSCWPDRGKTGVYHVRIGSFPPEVAGKLLCRTEATILLDWFGQPLNPTVQRLLEMVLDASHGYGDDLSSVDEATPIVELDDGARRCEALGIEAVGHFARGDWRHAVSQAANGAQLELLILGQRLGYDALWRALLIETEVQRGQEAQV